MSIRQSIKELTPPGMWRAGSQVWYALQRAGQIPSATLHPWRRQSIVRLAAYHDSQRGKRCFIIGNGPSLKKMDLSKLKKEYTFGLNRVYLLFPEIGFQTTYLVVVNDLVIEQFGKNILDLDMPAFFSWHGRRFLPQDLPAARLPIFLHTTYTGPLFARDARRRMWEGATVTYVALQLAYFMGFETVVLIGVDHNFSTPGKPNTTVISSGEDPNHFNPAYFGQGVRWQLPDLETSERAYRMARAAYETDGRVVQDATVGGKLTVFSKVDYLSLF